MEKNIENTLNNFIGNTNGVDINKIKEQDNKTVILNKREGLIERIDKQYLTEDGRLLLREQY